MGPKTAWESVLNGIRTGQNWCLFAAYYLLCCDEEGLLVCCWKLENEMTWQNREMMNGILGMQDSGNI